ncbi:major facilitator superfamily protein, partial [Kipferlia bialata]
FNNMDASVFPLAMTMVGEDLGLDNTYLQILSFLPPLMGATCALVSGQMGDRITPDRLLRLGLWISSISLLVSSQCDAFATLVVARACFGAGIGIAFPNTGPCIRALVPPARLTQAFGVLAVNVAIWTLISPLVMGQLLSFMPGGWHGVYAVVGCIGVVFAILQTVFIPWFPAKPPCDRPVDYNGIVWVSLFILALMTRYGVMLQI